MLQNLGDKITDNRLPDRSEDRFYMVTRREPRLVRRGPSWRLEVAPETLEIAPGLVDMVRHIVSVESFWASELGGVFNQSGDTARELLAALERLGVIFPIAV